MLVSHQERPRELKWYHAGPMLYGDWGTSRFYVLGLACYFALFSSFWYILGVGPPGRGGGVGVHGGLPRLSRWRRGLFGGPAAKSAPVSDRGAAFVRGLRGDGGAVGV